MVADSFVMIRQFIGAFRTVIDVGVVYCCCFGLGDLDVPFPRLSYHYQLLGSQLWCYHVHRMYELPPNENEADNDDNEDNEQANIWSLSYPSKSYINFVFAPDDDNDEYSRLKVRLRSSSGLSSLAICFRPLSLRPMICFTATSALRTDN